MQGKETGGGEHTGMGSPQRFHPNALNHKPSKLYTGPDSILDISRLSRYKSSVILDGSCKLMLG